jgi:ATP-dependent Clp protease ATP-binding subunit ClpC
MEIFQTLPGQLIAIAVIAVLIYYATMKKQHEAGGSAGPSMMSKMKGGRSVTPTLDSYTIDFTELEKIGRIDPVIGRHDEVLRLAQVLSRRGKNNALLIGPPGVGKTAIVEALAQRIIQKDVPEVLLNKRVLALDVTAMLSGTKYRGEFEERAKKLVKEMADSNRSIILFIDEVHSVIQSQGTEGAINFSDILKPALARGDLQMVGATTIAEYEKYIKTDPALERRFQLVMVDEPDEVSTLQILQGVKDKYREYHKVEFTDGALEAAVKLSNELVRSRTQPDKAIDAIDEAASMVKVSHVHESIPTILYQAAVATHPDLAEIWKQIQEIDKKIATILPGDASALLAERENFEQKLADIGVLVVDATDVESVVKQWVKG